MNYAQCEEDQLVITDIASLKTTQKQVKMGYSVSIHTEHSETILAVSPEI